jgi:hypothetical protein
VIAPDGARFQSDRLSERAEGADLPAAESQRALQSTPWPRNLALAGLFLLSALVPLISGLTTQVLLLAVVVILLADAVARGRLALAVQAFDLTAAGLGAFILYAAVSAAWAVEPSRSLTRAAAAAVIAFGSVAAAILVRREARSNLFPMATGLWIGFLIGVLFCLFELLTGHIVKLWVLETLNVPADMWPRLRQIKFVGGSTDPLGALNRSIASLTLLLWPALMVVVGLTVKRWRRAAAILLTALVVVVVMLSAHTTSKVAIVLGLLCFALAYRAPRLIFHVFAAAWLVSCLAIVPAARWPYQLDLHNAPWLKDSAQHRVVIWRQIAEQTLKAPILGRGADMTHVLAPVIAKTLPAERFSIAAHPHNVFLQTWFELGLVGGLLLMTAGLGVLWRVRRLGPQQQPFAYAMLACAGASLHAAFGMWQFWYMCLFGLATVWFALGQRALESDK